MRYAIYCRVSTDAQERDGTSLDTQERECRVYVEEHGGVVVEVVRESASGYSLERPGLDRVRQQVAQGDVDMVVAHALDRLSRKQTHVAILVEEVDSAGVAIEFVTEKFEDTAVGQLIMNVKAFAAEFEREKITERTMRGKAERARSGRVPQGTGRGIYGYRYLKEEGRRETHPAQAAVVRRIFEQYVATKSFSAVANDLNDTSIPAFAGGKWYPITIRNVVTNETYTGRMVYRRTKRVPVQRGRRGATRVVTRPEEEWIEVEGATPRIISDELWERTQAIINDPERIKRRPEARKYLLSGRANCRKCGSAMVGQTLTNKGKPYTYYRCRHAYTRTTGHRCESRYIRADKVEGAVWDEVERVLTEPALVMRKLAFVAAEQTAVGPEEVERVDGELEALTERERRLIRLYALGNADEQVVDEELADVRREQAILEQERSRLSPPTPPAFDTDPDAVEAACTHVLRWLQDAGPEERKLVLEALQLTIQADKETILLDGVLPEDPPGFITDERTSRCLFNGRDLDRT